MPLDPQVQPLVDFFNATAAAAASAPPQTAAERRAGYQGIAAMVGAGPELHSVSDTVAPGPAGDIPLRVYRPSADDPVGIITFFHGGGWCIGDLDTHDEVCRSLAARSGATVVAVDYRLGPEHRFPAAVDDSWAALRWVDEHRAHLATPGARIVVAGDSAGGNLAAVVSILARDAGGPELAAQLLVYPGVDMGFDTDRFPSHAENASGYILTRQTMDWFADNYLDCPGSVDDWRASPLRAVSHADLPPALVITAEFDPLRDEGAAYAEALRAAGTEVEHSLYDGMVHIFFQLGPIVDAGSRAVDEVASAARRHLDGQN